MDSDVAYLGLVDPILIVFCMLIILAANLWERRR